MKAARTLASYIDHTNLSPLATKKDIEKLCREAVDYGFAAVCINPCHVELASKVLENTGVKVAAVVGFPLGASTTATKVFEAEDAVKRGASEIDMVINIAALKEGLHDFVEEEIRLVRRAIGQALLKVIIEAPVLKDDEKRAAAKLAVRAGADMLKTCTGYNGKATVEDVRLLKDLAPSVGVKASGGIRDAAFALELIAVGADRIGTSSALEIMRTASEPRR